MGKIKFFRATEAQYNSIGSPDKDAIYFITDKKKIYVDGICYSSSSSSTQGDQTHPNYVDVKADQNGYLIVPSDTIPVAVQIEGNTYDINNCVITKEGQNYKLDSSHFLTKANLASYTGFYRVWRAGGKPGEDGAPGEQGVGIINIQQDFSQQEGDINQITIYTSDGSFYTIHTRNGSKGTDGKDGSDGVPIEDNYVDVDSSELINGYIVVEDITIPVKVEINGVGYDIDNCPVIKEGGKFKMLADYFLAKANLSSYNGTYRVWRAGGKAGADGTNGKDGKSFDIDTQGTTEQRLSYPAPTGDDIKVVFYDTTTMLVYVGVYENSAWNWGVGISLKGDKGDPGVPNTLSIGTVKTGAEGTSAKASITGDSPNQKLNLTIPKGDKGDPFTVDAIGLLSERSKYDAMEEGFSFLATDNGSVYFKQSDASGDWSNAVPFKGDKGDKGEAGTNTYVLCICQQSPDALFDGMIWIKGGTDTPKFVTAVGGTTVLTEEPSDTSSLRNGTFIITEE